MLGHKVNLGKFTKIEITSSIFSDNNTMRLEINYKKKLQKNTNIWKLNIVAKQQMDYWRNQRGSQKILSEKGKQKHNNPKPTGCSKSSSKTEFHSNTILPQETRKISNNLTLHLKQLEKEEQRKPKVSRRKEIIKIRVEIETKKTIEKINDTKTRFFEKINSIDKPLARLMKKKRERVKINKIKN